MSGISILKDGSSLIEYYGSDLDKLEEGDKVGVVRAPNGELFFYVNGENQGKAPHQSVKYQLIIKQTNMNQI